MERIEVIFPVHIPVQVVIDTMESNIKELEGIETAVEFQGVYDGENSFFIECNCGPKGWFLIGTFAEALIQVWNK